MTAEADGVDLGARSLVDLVVTRVRADILRGTFAPGERLVEEQLTRRFGTSRAPLREALRLLGQQGLVEHLPRRGVRVCELSARDIDELFSLRDALERFALECALGAADPAEDAFAGPAARARLDTLERAVVGIERATGSAEMQAEAHRSFHLALVGLAGHRHLLRVYEPVLLQLQVYMATNMRREAEVRPPDQGAKRHRVLFEAIAGGDLAVAVAALEGHGARAYLAPELGSD